ncbi:uncharacterized protein BYT42DRAFT_566332 [Radiomyces spectabilis]|uniref:uncharacterized protein n=1 Tax=Radiomyces spectabilis TaxID=64574 RepID=UPI00221E97CB|nr:uncharacterized protein BYT42DRAFT_566332 [Radiomyces spectabilis]KAI8381380.1 hypothetical protein BYT42DRAFT_566332 [Radiomyces spectabilis]
MNRNSTLGSWLSGGARTKSRTKRKPSSVQSHSQWANHSENVAPNDHDHDHDRELQYALALSQQEAKRQHEQELELLRHYEKQAKSRQHRTHAPLGDRTNRSLPTTHDAVIPVKEEHVIPVIFNSEEKPSVRANDNVKSEQQRAPHPVNNEEGFEIDDLSAWIEAEANSRPSELDQSPKRPSRSSLLDDDIFQSSPMRPLFFEETEGSPLHHDITIPASSDTLNTPRLPSEQGEPLLQSSPVAPLFFESVFDDDSHERQTFSPTTQEDEQNQWQSKRRKFRDIGSSSSSDDDEALDLDQFVEKLLSRRQIYPPRIPRNPPRSAQLKECPICSCRFPENRIILHAANCIGASPDKQGDEASISDRLLLEKHLHRNNQSQSPVDDDTTLPLEKENPLSHDAAHKKNQMDHDSVAHIPGENDPFTTSDNEAGDDVEQVDMCTICGEWIATEALEKHMNDELEELDRRKAEALQDRDRCTGGDLNEGSAYSTDHNSQPSSSTLHIPRKSMATGVARHEASRMRHCTNRVGSTNHYATNDEVLEDTFDAAGFGGEACGLNWESVGQSHYG